jgi:amidohydrolase
LPDEVSTFSPTGATSRRNADSALGRATLASEWRADLVDLRRQVHRNPELSHEETETAALVADRLRAWGIDEVYTGIGGTGIVGVINGRRPGPMRMLRADMDALPVRESDRGQPYRSTRDGVHHACAHDGHVAILLTTARILASSRDRLAGSVLLVFQPAEEAGDGAVAMLRDGLLARWKPDACFGLHLWNELPVGTIDVRAGAVMAHADSLSITVTGRGGHAASPDRSRDPIVAGASIVLAAQTIVSRATPPREMAVLTIGSIHAGTVGYVIPDRLDMQGTLRTFDPELRGRLLARLAALVERTGDAFDLTAELRVVDSQRACLNDPAQAELVRRAAADVVGPEKVTSGFRTAGADDMAEYLAQVPGCYFFVGSASSERGLVAPHHSPDFDFDEGALEIGALTLAEVTFATLG